ncbi:tyrosine-type recombinase/integrase [Aminobacterium colombiense]
MLTEMQCRQAKAREKVYSLSDGNGLFLEIRPNGAKYWIGRLWDGVQKKEIRRSFGRYPQVLAREARDKNIDFHRQGMAEEEEGDTFAAVADEWLEKKVAGIRAPSYERVIRIRLDKYILPKIGKMRVDDISPGVVLEMCREIEELGIVETAHRIRQLTGQVFRYAIATCRTENDPTISLRGALRPAISEHYAAITDPKGISVLWRNIDAYGPPVVRLALKFSAYTFCRPGEIRHAEWTEINWKKVEWRIPGEKMKMGRPHVVPLASPVIELLEELKGFTGTGRWLFPSARNDGRCMSDNTVRVALRTMGYRNSDMTAHGFRSMASTTLNEHGFRPDLIERQLAHVERNQIRAAYNHAEWMDERREMMSWWADWLEGLK